MDVPVNHKVNRKTRTGLGHKNKIIQELGINYNICNS